MDIIFSKETLQYRSAGHPESPDRVKTAYNIVKDKYRTIKPTQATISDLATVHSQEFIDRLTEGNFTDPDCPRYSNLMHYVLYSVGGALTAQETEGFSLMRPPGHHAGKNFLGGFCYANNIAIAVKKSELRTLIVDFDGHHGNGTEDIFFGDDQVVYISLHRSYGFPGTGKESRKNMLNYPLEVNCGDKKYLETIHEALDEIEDEEFEQVAFSAGFDAHRDDPLASLGLSRGTFRKIGEIFSSLDLPMFAVLEGGYVGEDVGRNLDAFLQGVGG